MPLEAGRQLGPYEIVSAIGAGGMGEVYKARYTRLDRASQDLSQILGAEFARRGGEVSFREKFLQHGCRQLSSRVCC